jgi:hypothetical protein
MAAHEQNLAKMLSGWNTTDEEEKRALPMRRWSITFTSWTPITTLSGMTPS